MGERKVIRREGPMASVIVRVMVGSSHENENEYGMAHFMEHMMFKGNKIRNESEQADLVDMYGLDINAYTTKEITEYHISGIASKVELMMDILSNMLRFPLLSEEAIEREKGVVLEEIVMNKDDNNRYFQRMTSSARYKGSAYEHHVLGTEESVSSFTKEMCDTFHERCYDLSNMDVIVVGTCDNLEDLMYKYFPEPVEEKILLSEYRTQNPGELNLFRDIEGEEIKLYVKGLPGTMKRESLSLGMVMAVLGYGMSSRLFKDLRVKQSLCYSVYAYHNEMRNWGDAVIGVSTTPEKAETTLSSIFDHLKEISENGVSEEELFKAVNMMKSYYASKFETAAGTSEIMMATYDTSGVFETFDSLCTLIDSITVEDLNKAAKYLGNKDTYMVCRMSRNYDIV